MSSPRGKRVVARLSISLDGHAYASSADLSKDGFCLETSMLVKAGSTVRGVVLHGPLMLAFTGRVVWATPGDPRACTAHRLGVRFEQISPGLRALLGLTLRG